MTRWTGEQEDYALDREGLVSHQEIARRLGKTTKAVESKIARLKGAPRRQFERRQFDRSVSRETVGIT